ncbi:cysteine hydrolase family protein [Microbacterium sp.]|uniref:cysteine hydrolase family protein n=1 Tax=Microbacterium sp. TaxID=51671 RepID=UPI003A93DC57
MTRALIIIDMQVGFDDLDFWGPTTNHACEENVRLLISEWERSGEPIVVVRHDSLSESSPLHPANPGNALVSPVGAIEPALLVVKSVNSAFYGSPDLHAWLQEASIDDVVICGIQTNMCVETTARMAGNLGYSTTVVLDATRTFELNGYVAGIGMVHRSADELMANTALVLQEGGFARIASTREFIAAGATG